MREVRVRACCGEEGKSEGVLWWREVRVRACCGEGSKSEGVLW